MTIAMAARLGQEAVAVENWSDRIRSDLTRSLEKIRNRQEHLSGDDTGTVSRGRPGATGLTVLQYVYTFCAPWPLDSRRDGGHELWLWHHRPRRRLTT